MVIRGPCRVKIEVGQTRRHFALRLEALPRYEVETFYKATHNACRYVTRLPSPRLIQGLVQAWRALHKR